MATSRPIASTEDIIRVRKVLRTKRDRALFELGINLAFRASDLLSITLEQVMKVKVGSKIIIAEQKTAKLNRAPRRAELNQQCITVLKPLIAERLEQGAAPTDPLFVTAQARKGVYAQLTVCSLSRMWKDWCAEAGLELDVGECFGSHSARKTKGHILRTEDGVGLEVLQQVLGHSSIKVTQHYLHIEKKEVSDFYQRKL
jgi:integrase